MHILIVDDSKSSRDVLRYLVQKHERARISEAANGMDALDIIRTEPVNILITDIKMPQMDGLELIERAREYQPDLQLIVFSAIGDFAYAKKALQLGVVNYLLKPINAEEFCKTLQQVTARYRNSLTRSVWEQFEQIVALPEPPPGAERGPEPGSPWGALPPPLNEYHGILIAESRQSGKDGLAAVEAALPVQFPSCAIGERQSGRVAALLRGGPSDLKTGADAIYSVLETQKEPCSVFSTAFDSSAAGLWRCFHTLTKQMDENRFWESPAGSYSPGEPAETSAQTLAELFNQAEGIGKHIAAHAGDAKEPIRRFLESMRCQGVGERQCKYACSELIKQIFLHIHAPLSLESCIESVSSARTVRDVETCLLEVASFLAGMSSDKDDGKEFNHIILTAQEIVQNEYMNDLNRDIVAGRVYMSPTYFSHLFKKQTGKSFTQYLNDFRMGKACELLRRTTYNIASIAQMVGFTNYPYFCARFRSKYGQTCIQYRKAHFKEGD